MSSTRRGLALPGAVFAMGAFALAAQTALFREYLVVYGGNELGVGFFFASWLGWVGAGALAALAVRRRRAANANAGGRGLPLLLAAYPPALLLQLVLIRSLRSLAGVAPTDLFPTGDLFLATLLTNAPVSLVTGALFPIAAGEARSVARVYVLECAGAFAGGGGVTLVLLAGGSALAALPFAAALVAGTGAALALARGSRVAAALNALLLLGAAVLLLPPAGGRAVRLLDELQWRDLYPKATLLARTDTPYRRVSVARMGGQTLALANGRILSAWPGGEEEIPEAALLAVQPAKLDRVLLVGDGLEALAGALLRYPVGAIVLIAPDRRGHEFLMARLPAAARAALENPRVTVAWGDPRRRIPEAVAAGGAFDLAVVSVGDPDTLLAAREFTVGFYRLVRAALADGGVLATPITSAENAPGEELANYGASVLATLSEVFAEVAVTPGDRAWFLAGSTAGRVSVDPAVLEARLTAIPVAERRFEPARFSQLLPPDRAAAVREAFERPIREAPSRLVATDRRPVTFLLDLLVLARRQGAGLTRTFEAIRGAGIGIFLLPALVVLVLRLRRVRSLPDPAATGRFAAGYLLVTVGAASIALALILLLELQARFGLLFATFGLANALFMAGLTLGGAAGARIGRRPGPPGPRAIAAGGLTAGMAFLLPGLAAGAGSEATFLALFLVTGAVFGLPFPLAARVLAAAGAGAERAGGSLDAADHLGGAAGAALAGVLLVPLFGTAAAARLLGFLLLTGPVLLLAEGWFRGRRPSSYATFPYVGTGYILAGVVISAALLAIPVRRELDRPRVRLPAERLREALGAGRILEVDEPWLHYDAWEEGGAEPRSHAFSSMAVAPDVTGFAGPLNLLVALDRDGTLRRVELIGSKETPSYIRELPGFLEGFAGKDAGKDFRLVSRGEAESPFDLVEITGATVSCRAAVETVNRAKNRALEDLLDRPPPAASAPPSLFERIGRRGALTLLLFLLAVPVFLRGGSRVRLAFLVVVLGVLGFAENVQLSLGRAVEVLALQFPPAGNVALAVLAGGVLLLGAAFGPVYCGLLCPFGAAQEIVSRASARLGLLRRPAPEADRRARFLKHVVLAVAATSALLLGADRVLAFDPLETAFSLRSDALGWTLIGAVLLLSALYFRFWCRYLCPVGALLSLLNRVALLRGLARRRRFGRCDLGVGAEADLDCIQCNRCLSPSGAARRPAPSRLLAAALVAVMVLVAAEVLSPAAPVAARGGAEAALAGKPRDLDVDEVRRQLIQGDLSDREALFYRKE